MTKEEILSMAREAGLYTHKEVQTEIARFADLVAAHEREACAQIAEEWLGPTKDRELHIAAAIRSRSEP
jgi:uncharacterized membrane protein